MLTITQSLGTRAPIDLHKEKVSTKRKVSISSKVTGENGSQLDAYFWLPLCASSLNISKDLRDYVVVPVIGLFSDLPNTNGDSMSKSELLQWKPTHGCPAYKTFKGKPTHVEHDYGHDILLTSRGVILDSYISPLRGYAGNHAKVVLLAAFDRGKDPALVDSILNKKVNTYSVGATYNSYCCTISGMRYSEGMRHGPHTDVNVPTYLHASGQLAFRRLYDLVGYEISVVSYPAFTTAVSDSIFE